MAYLAPADMWALSRRTVLHSVLRSCAADNAFHLVANFYYPPQTSNNIINEKLIFNMNFYTKVLIFLKQAW